MLGIEPVNDNVFKMVTANAKRANLDWPDEDEALEIESARDRFDVLIGIVEDNDAVNVSDEQKEEDRKLYGYMIETYHGNPVENQEDKIRFIFEQTHIDHTKIQAFLYEEEIEMAACGVVYCQLSPSMSSEDEQKATETALAELNEIYDSLVTE